MVKRVIPILVMTGVLLAALSSTSEAGKTLRFRACEANASAGTGTDRYAVTGGVSCGGVRWFVTHEFHSMETGVYRRFGHRYICGTSRAKGGQAVQCLKDVRVRPGEQQRAFRFRVRE